VVELREDLRENRPLDASEFAIHLDQIREGRAHKDYTDPQRFFDRTFVTGSLLDLASQVLRRLSGVQVETSAVFNMATQFGGGKSHSLTALYHLAKNGEKAKSWNGVDRILARGDVKTVPEAAVAVFMGKEFDSLQGRGGGDEPVRKTPWGEIAWQLGGAKSLAVLEQHEREFIEPKGDAIRAMLPKDRPVLILMDEAQTIYPANLDTLQAMVNEQTQTAKLLQVVLLAQPNFEFKLAQKAALRSRIAGGTTLNPLTPEDALDLLRHRMSVAGGDFDRVFPEKTHKPIYDATNGNPRDLCVLCDAALFNSFALRRTVVDTDSLGQSLQDLSFKGWRGLAA
jgi:hypothetical protein